MYKKAKYLSNKITSLGTHNFPPPLNQCTFNSVFKWNGEIRMWLGDEIRQWWPQIPRGGGCAPPTKARGRSNHRDYGERVIRGAVYNVQSHWIFITRQLMNVEQYAPRLRRTLARERAMDALSERILILIELKLIFGRVILRVIWNANLIRNKRCRLHTLCKANIQVWCNWYLNGSAVWDGARLWVVMSFAETDRC